MATVTIRSVSWRAMYQPAIDNVTAKMAYQMALTYQRGN